MFVDLLSEQTFADELVGPQERLATLTTVEHEVDTRRHTAVISAKVTESGFARVVTAVWGFLVGGATIATFALLTWKG
jgi:hypothetical protein